MPDQATIVVKCPCGTNLRVPISATGKGVKCPKCGEPFRIKSPSPPRPVSVSPAAPMAFELSESSAASTRRVRTVLKLAAAVFMVMLAYLVYIIAATNLRASRRSENLDKARTLVTEGSKAVHEERYVQADAAFTEALSLLPDVRSRIGEEEELALAAKEAKSSIAAEVEAERKKAEDTRRAQEEARRVAAAEAAEKHRREEAKKRLREEEERQAKEVQKKAKEMYPSYKKAAESLADEVLKILSALEIGVSYQDYTKRLQDLQFNYNKFALINSEEEILSRYSSYTSLTAAVEYLRLAGDVWKKQIDDSLKLGDYSDLDEFERRKDEYEKQRQKAWKEARNSYQAAMAALARNE